MLVCLCGRLQMFIYYRKNRVAHTLEIACKNCTTTTSVTWKMCWGRASTTFGAQLSTFAWEWAKSVFFFHPYSFVIPILFLCYYSGLVCLFYFSLFFLSTFSCNLYNHIWLGKAGCVLLLLLLCYWWSFEWFLSNWHSPSPSHCLTPVLAMLHLTILPYTDCLSLYFSCLTLTTRHLTHKYLSAWHTFYYILI